jgi:hypothetical protein
VRKPQTTDTGNRSSTGTRDCLPRLLTLPSSDTTQIEDPAKKSDAVEA